MMRKIDLIVIHCSATRADRSLTPDDLEMQHRRRGFNGTGYHYYIRKDGTVHLTRPVERIGAQAKVVGHRDLSPDRNGNGEIEPEEWIKACPCFEVKAEFGTSGRVED